MATVSLLVGDIGITNIMVVSVTERTREIGIRRAICALEQQVLTRFLVQAMVPSLLEGGVVFGYFPAHRAARLGCVEALRRD